MKINNKEEVYKELADLRYKRGWSRLSMVRYLIDKYELGQTQAYEYIKEMMIASADAYNKINENSLADSISFMEEMKQKALAEGNGKLALEWTKELNKVNQLYIERKEVNISGNIDVRNLFGFDENDDDSVNDKA